MLPYAGPQALNAAFEVCLFCNPKSITLLGADLSSPILKIQGRSMRWD